MIHTFSHRNDDDSTEIVEAEFVEMEQDGKYRFGCEDATVYDESGKEIPFTGPLERLACMEWAEKQYRSECECERSRKGEPDDDRR